MTTTPSTHALSAFLPPGYAQRLALAAAARHHLEIDAITDELAKLHPGKVRPRADAGRFASVAQAQRDEQFGQPARPEHANPLA
jgi:hypothetical protein